MVTATQPARPEPRVRPAPAPRRRRGGWIAAGLSLPGFLWVALWLGVNTGPWVLERIPRSFVEELHYLRTLLPLIALGVAGLLLLGRRAVGAPGSRALPRVLWPWFAYGLVALLACATSPRPAHALYWALCYLAAFAVVCAFIQAPTQRERLERCRHLNHVTWAISVVLLLALVYISGELLFVRDYQGNLSGYGIVNRVSQTVGVAMVRAGGFARFAAIPAIFAFVLAWQRTGLARVLWGTVAAGAAAIVYLMQSRGALLGLAAALAFAMLVMGRRTRVVGVLALLFVAFSLATDADFTAESDQVMRHMARDRPWVQSTVTSGRTRDWAIAWERISDSPLWGWGPQADRHLLGFHVHNTYLYAWLASGIFGLLLFLAGLVLAWRYLIQAMRRGTARAAGHHTTLIQVGGLLAFFTVRGVPEVSGTMYGIDLLLLLPAIAWLGALRDTARPAIEGAVA